MEYVNALEQTFLSSLPVPWLDTYKSYLADGNPNSKRFPVMNPFHVLLISIGYLVLVYGGMAIMKRREKFQMTWFSLLHNGFLVLLSSYMCYELVHQAIVSKFTFAGNAIDETPNGLPLARVLWLFYISKPIEFIDTFIMILKKNFHQVSFLHVYHHVATFIIWWAVIYYAPGGDSWFSAALNAFVHVLMYSYYFLATLHITAPWKYYLTQFQMFQFALNMCQGFYDIFYDTPYPRKFAILLNVYMVTLLILFGNFYLKGTRKAAVDRADQKQKKSH